MELLANFLFGKNVYLWCIKKHNLFFCVNLVPYNFVEVIYSSTSFLVDSLGSSIHKIMSSVKGK